MKSSYPAAVLIALLVAGCSESGPLSPVEVVDSPAAGAASLSLSGMLTDDEDLMMAVMGGGIEDGSATSFGSMSSIMSLEEAGFTQIDVPGAFATRAFGVNAVGQVVGSYTDATGTHGFLWDDGAITTIKVPLAISTEAWGINPQGDIVGRYRKAANPRTFGFLLRDGVYTDISVGNHLHTLPIKISPSGEIAGCFHDTNFLMDMRGYIQRGSRVSSYEALPSTMHNGVTPGGGVIAGISFTAPLLARAYVITRGVYSEFGYPGATFTQAWDVSPTGTVVGYFNAVDSHGFVRDNDGLRQVDVPGARWTRIFGINPRHDMAGTYADAAGMVHGFLMPGGANR